MDDGIDDLVLRVKADTTSFARDVDSMRGQLEGSLTSSATKAGRAMEDALSRFVRTGKFGFEDLNRAAATLGDIVGSALGGGSKGKGSDGLFGNLLGFVGGLLGLPGRATGGPVTAGRPYMVGEQGPEVFVPLSAGRVEALGRASDPAAMPVSHETRPPFPSQRPVNVTVNVTAPRDTSAAFMTRTGAQIAYSARRALSRADFS